MKESTISRLKTLTFLFLLTSCYGLYMSFVYVVEGISYIRSASLEGKGLLLYGFVAFFLSIIFFTLRLSPLKKLTTWLLLAFPLINTIQELTRDLVTELMRDPSIPVTSPLYGAIPDHWNSVWIYFAIVFALIKWTILITLMVILYKFVRTYFKNRSSGIQNA